MLNLPLAYAHQKECGGCLADLVETDDVRVLDVGEDGHLSLEHPTRAGRIDAVARVSNLAKRRVMKSSMEREIKMRR